MSSLARATSLLALIAIAASSEIDCSAKEDGSCSADPTTLLQAKVAVTDKILTGVDKGKCETYENTEKLCKDGSNCCKDFGCGGFDEDKSYMQCYPCDWKDFGTTFTSDSCKPATPTPATTEAPTPAPAPAVHATVPVVWQVIKTKTGKGDMSAEEINKLMDDVNKRFTGVDVDTWTPPEPGSIPGPDVKGIIASKDNCNEKCNVAFCYKKGTMTNPATKKQVTNDCYCDADFCKLFGRKYPDELAFEKPTAMTNKLGGKRLDTGIRFTVDSIKYVTNDDWHFHCCCTHAGFNYKIEQQNIFDQLVDKTTVRSKATVIVCDMSTKGGGTAGQSSISGSASCPGGPGVMVDRNSMNEANGGNADTLVHEFGHFLGLDHTFAEDCGGSYGTCKTENKCNPNLNKGDGLDDTPIHVKQGHCNIDASGEPANSCPNQPGKDPLDNFMSYSSCHNMRFTEGQVKRMRGTIDDYFPAFLTKVDGRVAKDFLCDPSFPNKVVPAGYKPPKAPSGGGGGGGGGDGVKKCSNLEAGKCGNTETACVCTDAIGCCKGFGCAMWKEMGATGSRTCLPCDWADGGATLEFTKDSCKK